MITLKEVVIVVASATATIAVGYVALIGTIILTAQELLCSWELTSYLIKGFIVGKIVLKNRETGMLIIIDDINEWREELQSGEYEYVEMLSED